MTTLVVGPPAALPRAPWSVAVPAPVTVTGATWTRIGTALLTPDGADRTGGSLELRATIHVAPGSIGAAEIRLVADDGTPLATTTHATPTPTLVTATTGSLAGLAHVEARSDSPGESAIVQWASVREEP